MWGHVIAVRAPVFLAWMSTFATRQEILAMPTPAVQAPDQPAPPAPIAIKPIGAAEADRLGLARCEALLKQLRP
jgi:hypothetical protein